MIKGYKVTRGVSFVGRSADALHQKRLSDDPEIFLNLWEYNGALTGGKGSVFEVECYIRRTDDKSMMIQWYSYATDEMKSIVASLEKEAMDLALRYGGNAREAHR